MTPSSIGCFLWTVGRIAALAFAVAHVTACGVPPFDTLHQEQDSETAHFQRVFLHSAGGPCTEEMDCEGFYELLADGTFRVDRFGEYQGGGHEVHLSSEDLENATRVAMAPGLLKLMRGGPYPCGHVTDSSNTLTLELEGERRVQEVTACDWPEVRQLRETLRQLADTYVK